MPSLSVRGIEDDVYERLKERAARRGVSMEEEVRQLIRRAVAAPESLSALARRCFGPDGGVDLELPPRSPHQPIVLDD